MKIKGVSASLSRALSSSCKPSTSGIFRSEMIRSKGFFCSIRAKACRSRIGECDLVALLPKKVLEKLQHAPFTIDDQDVSHRRLELYRRTPTVFPPPVIDDKKCQRADELCPVEVC